LKLQISSKIRSSLLGLAILLCAGFVWAQPPMFPDDSTGGPGDHPRWGRERIETVIIGKFSSELNLTPEQAEKFFPRFKQFQNQAEERQRNAHQRRMQMDKLSDDPNADKGQVNSLVDAQNQDQRAMLDLKNQFLNDVSSFLTPQQISRCSILLDDLPRRVQQFIEQHREGKRGGDGQGHGRRRGY
jgi:Spy/CpxP family protein refolding chaperone